MALISSVNAQVTKNAKKVSKTSNDIEIKPERKINNTQKAVELWGDTFGTPSDWVTGNAGNPLVNWQIGVVSNTGSYPTGDIESTSATDGYAMLDSDAIGGSTAEYSWIQNADSRAIDLQGNSDVVVQFENNYRRWDSQIYMVVGFGDGTGSSSVVWPTLSYGFDASTDVNVYEVFPTLTQNNDESDNPELVQIIISDAIAANASGTDADVYIRFVWTGTYGYSWFIDDVSVVIQPTDDIQLISSWVLGENNEGIEYGRVPLDQLDANLTIGSEVFNFGTADQTAVEVNADFTSFSSTLMSSSILSGASEVIENTESPSLVVGLYEGTYTATSAAETAGAEFFNNTYLRNFEVTNNIYSTDGIGVHPAANLTVGSIGTDSFTDGADELILANRYHIKNTSMISGIRIMLASGTVAGGELIGKVFDTTSFFANDMSYLYQTSEIAAITAADITNGYVDLWFSSVISLPADSYYFGIEMFSNANTADIRVLDDQTVAQPNDASMIYISGDQIYTNGTALGIRLLMGDQWGVGLDENTLTGVSIYPNPSEGIVNITNDNNTENSIVVYDLLGNSILSTSANAATSVDLSSNAAGIYMIVVSNENGSIVERVSIK